MELLEPSYTTDEQTPENPPVVATIFDLIDWGGRPQDYFLNRSEEGAETAYKIISGTVQNFYLSVKANDEAVIKDLEERNKSLKEDVDSINNAYEGIHQQHYELSRENNDLKLQLEDQKSRVSAAALQLDEANQEIERLKSQVHDLQVEKAVGVKQAIQVVDTKSLREQYEESKRIEREQALKELEEREAAKPAIYNIRNADMKGSILIATLAETDEDFEFPYLQRGKYREVTAAQAETFRAEYLERQAQIERDRADHAQLRDLEEVIPTAPRVEEEGPTDGLDQTASGMVGPFITEERITSIESRLAAAENALRAASLIN